MHDQRARIVQVAKSWIGTPYHHQGQKKGVGADCATFIAEVFFEAKVVQRFPIEPYSQQWHMHRNAEKYMQKVLEYAHEVEAPKPGDIVLWRFGRTFSHGGIVIEWPLIIHEYINVGCTMEDVSKARWLTKIGESSADSGKQRPVLFFSHWED